MSRTRKAALVFGGYLLAFVASIVAAHVYGLGFSAQADQTMGGMIAGGQAILGGAVFCLFALVPTGLALWYLRGNGAAWSAFSFAGLAFALGGLVAIFVAGSAGAASPRSPAFALVDLFGIVQMLGSPLWVAGFLLFAALAPARHLRRRLLAASAIEVVIGVCGLVHFLVPGAPV